MILEPGSKVLIVHRRLFEADHPRFFIGTVDQFGDGMLKATGHSWIRDAFTDAIVKKEGKVTKILPISSGTLMTYELSRNLDLNSIQFEFDSNGKFWMRGEPQFKIDLSETEHTRKYSRVSSIGQP